MELGGLPTSRRSRSVNAAPLIGCERQGNRTALHFRETPFAFAANESYYSGMRFFFILAFTAVATAGEYTTYIGDSYPRSVAAITADAAGNTYVVGNRAPAITPTAGIVFSAVLGFPVDVISAAAPPNDVFVSKLDTSGNILFTAVFAGKGQDRVSPSPSTRPVTSTSPERQPRRIFRSATRCNRRTVSSARDSSSN